MSSSKLQHRAAFLAAIAMLFGGLWLGGWALAHSAILYPEQPPEPSSSPTATPQSGQSSPMPTSRSRTTADAQDTPTATPSATPAQATSIVSLDSAAPSFLRIWLQETWAGDTPLEIIDANIVDPHNAKATLGINAASADGTLVYRYFFAAAARFDTANPTITWTQIQQAWQQESHGNEHNNDASVADASSAFPFTQTAILSDTLPALTQLLGNPGPHVQLLPTVEDLRILSRGEIPTLILLPFDQLEPRFSVLAIDGQTPIENAHYFDAANYPLVVDYYAHVLAHGVDNQDALAHFTKALPAIPGSNRDPDRLTVVAITGVTALTRMTAFQMDKFGDDWPARVIGPDLAAADITHASNEVSFIPGCQTDTSAGNLLFCSKPGYMDTLTASGVDIISLTGNHQNDFGLPDALTSLQLQADAGFRLFGGGKNMAEATAPLFMEHNGNRLAFLGANSFGPVQAWATEDGPGAAPLDLDALTASIGAIRQSGQADVIFVDVQSEERYEISPLPAQRTDFNAISQAGADVVTGVQAHSPQALEFTDGRLILFGLGNLYFDQMWSEPTRQGIVAKHTIYNNRHISTQLLVTIIEEYGQPRWATPTEREQILTPLFRASYWE